MEVTGVITALTQGSGHLTTTGSRTKVTEMSGKAKFNLMSAATLTFSMLVVLSSRLLISVFIYFKYVDVLISLLLSRLFQIESIIVLEKHNIIFYPVCILLSLLYAPPPLLSHCLSQGSLSSLHASGPLWVSIPYVSHLSALQWRRIQFMQTFIVTYAFLALRTLPLFCGYFSFSVSPMLQAFLSLLSQTSWTKLFWLSCILLAHNFLREI